MGASQVYVEFTLSKLIHKWRPWRASKEVHIRLSNSTLEPPFKCNLQLVTGNATIMPTLHPANCPGVRNPENRQGLYISFKRLSFPYKDTMNAYQNILSQCMRQVYKDTQKTQSSWRKIRDTAGGSHQEDMTAGLSVRLPALPFKTGINTVRQPSLLEACISPGAKDCHVSFRKAFLKWHVSHTKAYWALPGQDERNENCGQAFRGCRSKIIKIKENTLSQHSGK